MEKDEHRIRGMQVARGDEAPEDLENRVILPLAAQRYVAGGDEAPEDLEG